MYMSPNILREKSNSWLTPLAKWLDRKLSKKKSVSWLYTNDKLAEKGIRQTMSFTIITNNISFCNQASKRPVWQELQVSGEKKIKRISEVEKSLILMNL